MTVKELDIVDRIYTDTPQVYSRLNKLLEEEVFFVPNEQFQQTDQAVHQADIDCVQRNQREDLSDQAGRMYETELLTPIQEVSLFREMNYLKYLFCQQRDLIDPDRPELDQIDAAEELLHQAKAIRNKIVSANMRLVVSIAKKFVSPQHPLDDNLSDGTVALMQAVEKFDYDRGFRFSTYAYRAIVRNILRNIRDQQKTTAICPASAIVEELADQRQQSEQDFSGRNPSQKSKLLSQIFSLLDNREQRIVTARFALGAENKISTLQMIATELQISKERVRQLEKRALAKLRKAASDLGIVDLLEPAV